jgi:glycosyltransferase involved in cell wall biosynthesis
MPTPASPRVLLVTNSIVDDQLGGLQRYVTELSEALVGRGAQVTVLARRLSREAPRVAERRGATIVRRAYVSRRNPLYVLLHPLTSAAATAALVRSLPTDVVVHGHFPVQAAPLLVMRRRPFVYTFHAPAHKELVPEHQGRYLMPGLIAETAARSLRVIESSLVRRADRIAVLSEYMLGQVLELAPDARPRSEIIAGGIDLALFSPGRPTRDQWADGAKRLLFTARRMVPRTGVRELVEAVPALLSHQPGIRLAIAGSGPLHDEIENAIRRHGLGSVVRLLGTVGQTELIDWYRRADLAVMPTQELEGFGLAAVEAMGCATPVFATPVGALPEVVGQLGPEFIAAGRSPEQLAGGIATLLDRAQALEAAGAAARDVVERHYGWGTVAERYLELYEAVLRSRHRGRRSMEQ